MYVFCISAYAQVSVQVVCLNGRVTERGSERVAGHWSGRANLEESIYVEKPIRVK